MSKHELRSIDLDQLQGSLPVGCPTNGDGVRCSSDWDIGKDGGARLSICFISGNLYGLLWPSSGLPFGGAEVQIYTLASELARNPQWEVSTLTGNGLLSRRERVGNLNIIMDEIYGASHKVASQDTGPQSGGRILAESGRRWLDQRPKAVATTIRKFVRSVYFGKRVLSFIYYRLLYPRWLINRLHRPLQVWKRVMKWVRLLKSINADIYVTRCASPEHWYIWLACRLVGKSFVYMVAHDNDVSGEYVRSWGKRGKKFETCLRGADAIVCQHAEQVSMVRSRYQRQAWLIRSSCPMPVQTDVDASRTNILWIARADSWKQPQIFIDLTRRMREESFVMVVPESQVDPESLSQIRRQAAGLPNLRLLPGVSFEKTASLFQEAKVFINTSRAEGFPNTFLQAAASGTPIVSFAVNPEGVLERHEIGYCANGDPEQLERLVRLLCTDDALCVRLGENGRRYVQEQHSPTIAAGRFAEICLAIGSKRTTGWLPTSILRAI